MKTKMGDKAVAEIISAILLLAIAVVAFSVIYMNILSDDGPDLNAYVTIIGKIENNPVESFDVVFEHNRGERISTDSIVMIIPRGIWEHRNITSVGELLDPITSNCDDFWDIGERLIYNNRSYSKDWNIEARIIDSKTNSLILWGTLQQGYTGVLGGIWHLDEGTGSIIAHDSTNNSNHGTVHGSTWVSSIVKDNVDSNALSFNGEATDYVLVPDSPSLYITDEITVEAWFYPIFSGGLTGDDEFLGDNSQDITYIHISGDIFAFALWRSGGSTSLDIQTINLSTNCEPADKFIDSIIFDRPGGANGFDPDFIHINGSVYAFSHRWSQTDGYVTTINIEDDGNISDTLIDQHTFEPTPASNAHRSDIIHVSGDIYAIASTTDDDPGRGGGGNGIITTLEIAPNGTITNPLIDRFIFETNNDTERPRMLKISDTKNYIISYSRGSNGGYVKTINIEDNGTINRTEIDSFQFESNYDCWEPDLLHIASDPSNESNIYAIAYSGQSNNGYVITIEVKNNGSINNTIINSFKFDPSLAHAQPDIEPTNIPNIYAVAYYGSEESGYITTITIFDNGTILNTIIDTIRFTRLGYDSNPDLEPAIVHVAGNIYGVAYKGHGGEGVLAGLSLNGSGGFGPTEPFGGIFKDKSYSLNVNKTHVFATINNFTINHSGIISNQWNHVALTYDGSSINLYINRDTKISCEYPYENKKINCAEYNNLYFGFLFNGCLDEIAIYDYALSETQIKHHYDNPGDLEGDFK